MRSRAFTADGDVSLRDILHRSLTATEQSWTADSAPGVATWEVTLSARKVVLCVRWPATGITAHRLWPSQDCVCTALRLGAATSSNLGLWASMTSSIKPEVQDVSLQSHGRRQHVHVTSFTHRLKINGRLRSSICHAVADPAWTRRPQLGGAVHRD